METGTVQRRRKDGQWTMETGKRDGTASTGICNMGRKFAWPVQNKLLTGSVLFKPGKIPPKKKPNKEPAESIVSTGRVHFE